VTEVEAALAEAKLAMAFPLPAPTAPNILRVKRSLAVTVVMLVLVLAFGLWYHYLERDLLERLNDADKTELCVGRLVADSGTGDTSKAPCTSFPWSFSTTLPVFRCVGLVLFHILGWSVTAYFLRQHRVNYPYLLDFDSSSVTPPLRLMATSLKLITVFLAFFLWNVAVWLHELRNIMSALDLGVDAAALNADPSFAGTAWRLHAPHLCMVLFFLSVSVCPWNVFLRSGRWWLWRILLNCFLTPMVPLRYSHTWVTNQMSTVARSLSDAPYLVCMETYGAAHGFTLSSAKHCNTHVSSYWFFMSTIPSWLRMVQSIRRYVFQDRSARHLWNGLKYGNRVAASLLSWIGNLTPSLQPSSPDYSPMAESAVFYMWFILTVSNVIASYWWDVRKDWGLVNIRLQLRPAKGSRTHDNHAERGQGAEQAGLLDSPGAEKDAAMQQHSSSSPGPSLLARLSPTRLRVSCARLLLLPPSLEWWYVLSMIFDCICRVLSLGRRWPMEAMFHDSNLSQFARDTLMYTLESIRRNWASFHRLENEHLCNSEKFREMERMPVLMPQDYTTAEEEEEREREESSRSRRSRSQQQQVTQITQGEETEGA
jgi:hypothetical protein